MLVEPFDPGEVPLEIPTRSLGPVVAAAHENGGAGVVVPIFVGPLPDVSHQVHDPEGTCAGRVRIHVVGRPQDPAPSKSGRTPAFSSVAQGTSFPSSPRPARCYSHSWGSLFPAQRAYALASSIETQVTGFLSHPAGKAPFRQSRRKLCASSGR